MSAGISKIFTEEEKQMIMSEEPKKAEPVIDVQALMQEVPSKLNDVKDTVNTFMDKIALAKMHGDKYIEVSPEIFDHYMRGQKTRYFIYQDVRVYKYGEREGIEKDEARHVL